jgi:hypothetical protein
MAFLELPIPANAGFPSTRNVGRAFAMVADAAVLCFACTLVRRILSDRPVLEFEPGSLTASSLVTAATQPRR